MAKKKVTKEYTLKNWSIVVDATNIFQDSKIMPMMVQGEVYKNENFEDGTRITTSYVDSFEYDENNIPNKVITQNSIYILENISETYKSYLESVRQQNLSS